MIKINLGQNKPNEILDDLSESEKRKLENDLNRRNSEENKEIYIRGIYDCTFQHSIDTGFFITRTKKNFDISIIVRSTVLENSWIQINLTHSELMNIYKNSLSDEQKLKLPYDIVTIKNHIVRRNMDVYNFLYQLAFDINKLNKDVLIIFKNIKRNYNSKKFNYYWDGNGVIDFDNVPNPNWILLYN